jgi:hypothetical protein
MKIYNNNTNVCVRVLGCIVENVHYLFVKVKCAVLGDCVEILEMCWGFLF